MEWHPLIKEEAQKLGYTWQDTLPGSHGKETVRIDELPDNMADFDIGNTRLIE